MTKLDNGYEFIMLDDEIIHVPFDDLNMMQRSKFDGLVDTHLKRDIIPDRMDGEDAIDAVMNSARGTRNNVSDLLKQSTCDSDELFSYLKQTDSYLGTNYGDEFIESGKWPNDIQIPKDSSVLTSNGSIDWSQVPNDGFAVIDNVVDKKPYDIKMGEVIDRYGPSNGRFTSPVIDGKPYAYDQRALPYVEDVSKYHQYKVTGDFNDIEMYVKNCNDLELKADIEAFMDYKGIEYKDLVVYKGKIADGFESIGGGIQYQLPLPIDMLMDLKLLKIVK